MAQKQSYRRRPLLSWHELRLVAPLTKRLHDWYMRASSVGINAFSPNVSVIAFLSGPSKVTVDFEDIHLMFRLKRLDVYLVMMWCL